MSEGRLDSWLDAVDFSELASGEPLDSDAGADETSVDDPWSAVEVAIDGLSVAQRAFVADSSPGLGAVLMSGTLLAEPPLPALDDEAERRAEAEVIDADADDDPLA